MDWVTGAPDGLRATSARSRAPEPINRDDWRRLAARGRTLVRPLLRPKACARGSPTREFHPDIHGNDSLTPWSYEDRIEVEFDDFGQVFDHRVHPVQQVS